MQGAKEVVGIRPFIFYIYPIGEKARRRVGRGSRIGTGKAAQETSGEADHHAGGRLGRSRRNRLHAGGAGVRTESGGRRVGAPDGGRVGTVDHGSGLGWGARSGGPGGRGHPPEVLAPSPSGPSRDESVFHLRAAQGG